MNLNPGSYLWKAPDIDWCTAIGTNNPISAEWHSEIDRNNPDAE